MPYLVTYQRTYKVNGQGDDVQENDSDTFSLLPVAIAWANTKTTAAWAQQYTESVDISFTET